MKIKVIHSFTKCKTEQKTLKDKCINQSNRLNSKEKTTTTKTGTLMQRATVETVWHGNANKKVK